MYECKGLVMKLLWVLIGVMLAANMFRNMKSKNGEAVLGWLCATGWFALYALKILNMSVR